MCILTFRLIYLHDIVTGVRNININVFQKNLLLFKMISLSYGNIKE